MAKKTPTPLREGERSLKSLFFLHCHDDAEGVGDVLTAAVLHDPLVHVIGYGVHVAFAFLLGTATASAPAAPA